MSGYPTFYPAEKSCLDIALDSPPHSVMTTRSGTPDGLEMGDHYAEQTSYPSAATLRRPYNPQALAETIQNIHAEKLRVQDTIRSIHAKHAASPVVYDSLHRRNPYRRTPVDDSVLVGTIQNIFADVIARKKTQSWLKDVWRDDVEWAFTQIAAIVEQYNYVAIDTEFPGTILQHDDPALTKSSLNYLDLRDNVNQLSVIQLGLTFSDEFGNKPEISTFQFNLKFNLRTEQHDPRSIRFLREAGVDFNRHIAEGIDVRLFAERMLACGLVCNDNIRWICFHGMYDFGYLARVLSHLPLPDTPMLFFEQLYRFFPKLVDLKHLLRDTFNGGLNTLAESVGVPRCGTGHTGGSDALMTADVFFKVVALANRKSTFSGSLFGLEPDEFKGCDQWSWDRYDKSNYYKQDHPYINFFGLAGRGFGPFTYEGWYDMSLPTHPQMMY